MNKFVCKGCKDVRFAATWGPIQIYALCSHEKIYILDAPTQFTKWISPYVFEVMQVVDSLMLEALGWHWEKGRERKCCKRWRIGQVEILHGFDGFMNRDTMGLYVQRIVLHLLFFIIYQRKWIEVLTLNGDLALLTDLPVLRHLTTLFCCRP